MAILADDGVIVHGYAARSMLPISPARAGRIANPFRRRLLRAFTRLETIGVDG
jgi:hypothetical protein